MEQTPEGLIEVNEIKDILSFLKSVSKKNREIPNRFL